MMKTLADIFRAFTRPIVTIIFAAVIAQVVVEGITPPEWFIALATTTIIWWFGDRTVQHIKDSQQSIVDSQQPTADSRLPTANSREGVK